MEVIKWMMKNVKTGLAGMRSPYTCLTAEAAIAHLERIFSTDGAELLFSRTYWRARVEQVSATPGLTPEQRTRLAKLLESIPRLRTKPSF
jgi:histidinol-phosphate/aromatic aminotransferase/cobyric acid decarboxylase-like protein